MSETFAKRLKFVERRMASACEKAGRLRDSVRLLAVSKTKPPEAVRTALKLMRGDRLDVVQRIAKEASNFGELLRSPAARDALQAFIDRPR